MSRDFRDKPLFKKLAADAPNIEAEVEVFNKRYATLIKRDDKTVGTILRCHLVLEHFLDEYLATANPGIPAITSTRLTFAQKLNLADHPKTFFAYVMPGLKALNKVRNNLAHQLETKDIDSSL